MVSTRWVVAQSVSWASRSILSSTRQVEKVEGLIDTARPGDDEAAPAKEATAKPTIAQEVPAPIRFQLNLRVSR